MTKTTHKKKAFSWELTVLEVESMTIRVCQQTGTVTSSYGMALGAVAENLRAETITTRHRERYNNMGF